MECEWGAVAARDVDARVVKLFMVMAVKHAEDAVRAKWEARGVALGHNL